MSYIKSGDKNYPLSETIPPTVLIIMATIIIYQHHYTTKEGKPESVESEMNNTSLSVFNLDESPHVNV